jgi:hypothetical protein
VKRLRLSALGTADSAAQVQTFDATCGGPGPILAASFSETFPRERTELWRQNMTMKERIEVTVFGAILIVGLPALMLAAQLVTR